MLDKDDLWARNFQKNSQRVKKTCVDPSRFQRLGGGGLIFMVDQSGDGSGITPSWCTPPFHRWPCTSVRYSVESWLWRGDMSAEFHDRVILHLDADGKAPLFGRKKCSKNKYGGLTARFSENIYIRMYIFWGEIAKLFAQNTLTLSPTTSERYVPKATSLVNQTNSIFPFFSRLSNDSHPILTTFDRILLNVEIW